MATIRSAHAAVSRQLSRLIQARSELDASLKQAQVEEKLAQQAQDRVVDRALQAHPDPTTWPASVIRVEARELAADARQHHARISAMAQGWRSSGKPAAEHDLAQAQRQMAEADAAVVAAQDRYQRQPLLGPLCTWNESALRVEHLEQVQGLWPAPSRWSWGYWRARAEDRALWAVGERYERKFGPESFARDLDKLVRAWQDRHQAQAAAKAMTPVVVKAQRALDQGNQALVQAQNMGDLEAHIQGGLSRLIHKQSSDQQRAWLAEVVPDAVPDFLVAQARVEGVHRITLRLEGMATALETAARQLTTAQAKLQKGLRHAPGKTLRFDEAALERSVTQTLAAAAPLAPEALAALHQLHDFQATPGLIRTPLYQRATQEATSTWLLVWLLMDQQFAGADITSLGGLLGLPGVVDQFAQQGVTEAVWGQWQAPVLNDSPSLLPGAQVSPALDSSAFQALTSDLGATLTGGLDAGLIGSLGAGLDLTALPLALPAIDLPAVPFDLPSFTVDVPSVTVDMPTFDIPTIDTSSFGSVDSSSFGGFDGGNSW